MKFVGELRDEIAEHMTCARKSVQQQQHRRIGPASLAVKQLQPLDISGAIINRRHEHPSVELVPMPRPRADSAPF